MTADVINIILFIFCFFALFIAASVIISVLSFNRVCRCLSPSPAEKSHGKLGASLIVVTTFMLSVRVSEITLIFKTVLNIRHGVILPYGNVTANFFEIIIMSLRLFIIAVEVMGRLLRRVGLTGNSQPH